MDKMVKQTINAKLKFPLVIALLGVLLLVSGMFLPYMTASGELLEYIEQEPDQMVYEEFDLTASDLKDISILTVNQIITGRFGEDDGAIADVIVSVFVGAGILAALFIILKKPIAVIIFDLFTYGTFAFLNFGMREDFIDPDRYLWGISYKIIGIACAIVLVCAVWMLIKKIVVKNKLNAKMGVHYET